MHHNTAALHPSFNTHKTGANDCRPKLLKPVGPDHNIARAGFIFQRQEDNPFGTACAEMVVAPTLADALTVWLSLKVTDLAWLLKL